MRAFLCCGTNVPSGIFPLRGGSPIRQAKSTGPGRGETVITKGITMSKAAFVILASGDCSESLGRVVNALMGAYEMMESGYEIKIIFDGAGTRSATALA